MRTVGSGESKRLDSVQQAQDGQLGTWKSWREAGLTRAQSQYLARNQRFLATLGYYTAGKYADEKSV